MRCACFRRLSALILITQLLGLGSAALAQTTVSLTGGDAGQGLTLDPSRVLFAYDVRGSGTTTWQGVDFTPLVIGNYDSDYSQTSADPFPGQSSSDDVALRGILQNLGWDGFSGVNPLRHTFTGLTPNTSYRLDVLQFAGGFASREQAIVVNGSLAEILTISQTEALNTSLTATSDSSGQIQLLVTDSLDYGGTGHHDGAILNAVVLSSIPEPSTYALCLGLAGLAVAARMRLRRR